MFVGIICIFEYIPCNHILDFFLVYFYQMALSKQLEIKRRFQYTPQDMLMAVKAVVDEHATVNQATKRCGVPETTLGIR
jgi:hypothetical protein